MILFKVLRLFSRKSKLKLDCANAACMSRAPPTFNHVTIFFLSPPVVADFCAHLFSEGVSFCVAVVSTFAVYPFVSLHNVSSYFACWLEFPADLFKRSISLLLLVVYLLLYELNVLCIAIILMLFAFSALLLDF